jgi:hypothetical protein
MVNRLDGKSDPTAQYHPKSPGASLKRLRELAGVIALKGPVPSTKFLEEAEAEPPTERARD